MGITVRTRLLAAGFFVSLSALGLVATSDQRAQVTDAGIVIVDDGDPGYAQALFQTVQSRPGTYQGYNGDASYYNEIGRKEKPIAQWSFKDLPDGTYELYVTWNPYPTFAEQVQYKIARNDLNTSGSVPLVSQRNAPASLEYGGRKWHKVGEVMIVNKVVPTIMVMPVQNKFGYVVADAAMAKKVGTSQPISICGNGKAESGEECDDGNTQNGDGCSSFCQTEHAAAPFCGNTKLETGEECDDGNTVNGDGCTGLCRQEQSGTSGGNTAGDGGCPQVSCPMPPAGCGYAPDPTRDGRGCLVNPCGVLKCEPTQAQLIVDDGDNGFYTTTFKSAAFRQAFGKDATFFDPKAPANTFGFAQWTFSNLNAGKYEIYSTWPASALLTKTAAYSLNTRTGEASTITTDQTVSPKSLTLGGHGWHLLGTVTVYTSGESAWVILSSGKDGFTLADAMMAKKTESIPEPSPVTIRSLTITNDQLVVDYETTLNDCLRLMNINDLAVHSLQFICAKKTPVSIAMNIVHHGTTIGTDLRLCDSGTVKKCSGFVKVTGSQQVPACGNGTIETGEQCDDGNTLPGDGCSANCQTEHGSAPVCGNAKVETGEECDDGNLRSLDGCTSSCKKEFCGDNIRNNDPEEECDGPSTVQPDESCNAQCKIETKVPKVACNDGIDNDADGLIDLRDPGCANAQDNDESNAVITACTDSDSGVNPEVAGKTTGGIGLTQAAQDICSPEAGVNGLFEYFCDQNTIQFVKTQCPYGCENGACKKGGTTVACGEHIPALTGKSWQNKNNPLDVDNNGKIERADAFLIVSRLNTFGPSLPPASSTMPPPFYNVDGLSFTNNVVDPTAPERIEGRDVVVLSNYIACIEKLQPTEKVTLTSVVLACENNASVAKVTYEKNFDVCAHMSDQSGLTHVENHFCDKSGTITVPLAKLTRIAAGAQVKLCHGNNSAVCSSVVTVTGSECQTAQADVVVSKTGTESVQRNEEVKYVVTVQNTGGQTANGVVMTDDLPLSTVLNLFDGCTAIVTNTVNRVTCNVGTLTPGQSKTYNIVVVASGVSCNETLTNAAKVTTTSPESNTANNTSNTVRTNVTCQQPTTCPTGFSCTKTTINNQCIEMFIDCAEGQQAQTAGSCGSVSCQGSCVRCAPSPTTSAALGITAQRLERTAGLLIPNQKNVTLFKFQAQASNHRDVLFTKVTARVVAGNIANAQNYSLWVDTNDDGATDAMLEGGVAPQNGLITLQNLGGDGYVLTANRRVTFEIRGDFASTPIGSDLQLELAVISPDYVAGKDVATDLPLAGIQTNGVCPGASCAILVSTEQPSTKFTLQSITLTGVVLSCKNKYPSITMHYTTTTPADRQITPQLRDESNNLLGFFVNTTTPIYLYGPSGTTYPHVQYRKVTSGMKVKLCALNDTTLCSPSVAVTGATCPGFK